MGATVGATGRVFAPPMTAYLGGWRGLPDAPDQARICRKYRGKVSGAGYGNRTRLTGLGSHVTFALSGGFLRWVPRVGATAAGFASAGGGKIAATLAAASLRLVATPCPRVGQRRLQVRVLQQFLRGLQVAARGVEHERRE